VTGDTTASGYQYNFKKQGNNYLLQIDVDSLKGKVSTGADLAKALVEIASEDYDFHFTQYAADGNKLYIYDNRIDSDDRREATFDTAPYYAIDTDVYNFSLGTADGRSISMSYTYDFGDLADDIIVEMKEDNANGEYVKAADGSYEKYDAANAAHAGQTRYTLTTTYKKESDGTVSASLNDTLADYKTSAMQNMLERTNVQLDATNFTTMQTTGNENGNVAIKAVFESEVVESPYENGLHIQSSSNVGDALKIPRFAMNSVVLKLYKAGAKTYDQAQATIDYSIYANEVLSQRRSMYGAYQNRLEHTYNSRANAEENTQAAESRIRDTDMAEEMVNYSRHNILEQAGQSMLAQSNQSNQGILALLQ
jgi:flagellin-like hook-associated protein FlgL